MALDFPNSPTVGSTFTSGPGGPAWQWDGVKWESIGVPGATGAAGPVSRNFLHNPYFNIQQRGQGPWTAGGYTADRWKLDFGAPDTNSVSVIQLTDAQRAAIGDEAASYGLQNTFTGSATAGAYSRVIQPVEKLRRLSGKTVTLSFFAQSSAALSVGVNCQQYFGSGGSPSAVVVVPGQGVSIATTFARYQVTLTVPSIAGKTLGTNGDDFTMFNIWFSSSSTISPNSGIGVQSGTITLWGMQLEIGSQATPLEKIDPQVDITNCTRFFQAYGYPLITGYAVGGNSVYIWAPLTTPMRASPTVTFAPGGSIGYSNASGLAVNWISPIEIRFVITITATGYGYAQAQPTYFSADL